MSVLVLLLSRLFRIHKATRTVQQSTSRPASEAPTMTPIGGALFASLCPLPVPGASCPLLTPVLSLLPFADLLPDAGLEVASVELEAVLESDCALIQYGGKLSGVGVSRYVCVELEKGPQACHVYCDCGATSSTTSQQ